MIVTFLRLIDWNVQNVISGGFRTKIGFDSRSTVIIHDLLTQYIIVHLYAL